jgi:hypothetical protein
VQASYNAIKEPRRPTMHAADRRIEAIFRFGAGRNAFQFVSVRLAPAADAGRWAASTRIASSPGMQLSLLREHTCCAYQQSSRLRVQASRPEKQSNRLRVHAFGTEKQSNRLRVHTFDTEKQSRRLSRTGVQYHPSWRPPRITRHGDHPVSPVVP